MIPKELSEQLRMGSGKTLGRRRAVIGQSLMASAAMGTITLYQTGIIPHLPDPPLPFVNSEKVDASEEAYRILHAPDGALGLGSYAATLTLAAMGDENRAQTHPWIPLALAVKVGFDAIYAAKLTVDQWTKHRAFCVYCLIAAGATFATTPLVIPEALTALGHLFGRADMPVAALSSLLERKHSLA